MGKELAGLPLSLLRRAPVLLIRANIGIQFLHRIPARHTTDEAIRTTPQSSIAWEEFLSPIGILSCPNAISIKF